MRRQSVKREKETIGKGLTRFMLMRVTIIWELSFKRVDGDGYKDISNNLRLRQIRSLSITYVIKKKRLTKLSKRCWLFGRKLFEWFKGENGR